MIRVVYHGRNAVDFEARYTQEQFLEKGKRIDKAFDSVTSIRGLCDKYLGGGLFEKGSSADVVLYHVTEPIKIKNRDPVQRLHKSKIKFYFFLHYNPKNFKSTTFYKILPEKAFAKQSPIRNFLGESDARLVRAVVKKIKSLKKYKDMFGDKILYFLVENTNFGGIFNDLDSMIDVAQNFKGETFEELTDLTFPLNEYWMLSIISAIQDMDDVRLYQFLNHPKAEFIATISTLQNMMYDYLRVFSAFKEEKFHFEPEMIPGRLPDVKKYPIQKGMRYMRKMGPSRIKYIYEYLVKMFAMETYKPYPLAEQVKLQDLAWVLRGHESLIMGDEDEL